MAAGGREGVARPLLYPVVEEWGRTVEGGPTGGGRLGIGAVLRYWRLYCCLQAQ